MKNSKRDINGGQAWTMDRFKDLGFCKLDIHREERTGYPEVIFGQGKTAQQAAEIFTQLMEIHHRAMITRATEQMFQLIKERFPEAVYDPVSRLLTCGESLQRYPGTVVVACAGTSDLPVAEEGALASVVGGLVRRPVIAVPTSVGYGAHLSGLTPLFSMLTSCAAGVTVVNIDNGFGAGYAAAIIQQLVKEARDK
jgi:NCAIR mutase (PurE)-related protein